MRWKPFPAAVAALLALGLSAPAASASTASPSPARSVTSDQAWPTAEPDVSAVYTIDYDDAIYRLTDNGTGAKVTGDYESATDWEWVNEGGDCLGTTCWEVIDREDGACLTAKYQSNPPDWNLYTEPCSSAGSYEQLFQLFSNPPTNGYGVWYSDGVSLDYLAYWAVILNDSNGVAYVESPAIWESYPRSFVEARLYPSGGLF